VTRSLGVLAMVGAVSMALAAPAPAATRSVSIGLPPSAAKQFNEKLGVDVNDFFPHGVAVHVGDKVRFVPAGFHNVDLPIRGSDAAPLFVPNGTKVADSRDAANQAFWFNGQDNLGFNPSLLNPNFGKQVKYSGSKAINSGLPLQDRPKPMTVTFTKAGKFGYFCDVHPGMTGVVTVKKEGRRIASKKAVKKAVKRQLARALKVARGLHETAVADDTISLGVAGKHGTELFAFHPDKKTVPVGTELKFAMSPGSREAHTATFGSGDPVQEPASYLGVIAASFEAPTLDPRGAYPSDLPGTSVAALTKTFHGNGFWNSGVLDRVDGPPLPESSSVRFNQAGTYDVWCLIHPFMHGQITVTAAK
jgi:plastocyanin